MKKLHISIRALELGKYIVDQKTTIRGTAEKFKVPKSSVYSYITLVLKEEDKELYNDVRKQLDYNKSVRHLHGGQATKKKNLKK